jgi:hypothetical protein
LSYSIQFGTLTDDKIITTNKIPQRILSYIHEFETGLDIETFKNRYYGERVVFSKINGNHPGSADEVIRFIPADSPLAKDIDEKMVLIKHQEKEKYKPSRIVSIMKDEGFPSFTLKKHTELWQAENAKQASRGFGTLISDGQWYWYQNWLDFVREHCNKHLQSTR